MTDIAAAKNSLSGHSICLCKNGDIITDDGRGISPRMKLISKKRDLRGYAAADLIVGKAAAMLFVSAGIKEVFAKTISRPGAEYLSSHGIPYSYEIFTERIINRAGDDVCPMEKAVENISDAEEGYKALKKRLEELKAKT
ncbi:MAG: DUF1893 domain-containing protein [Clostridia bacterium]|nr:DUF1893 domain-containing protein [Clostridia bacterium]